MGAIHGARYWTTVPVQTWEWHTWITDDEPPGACYTQGQAPSARLKATLTHSHGTSLLTHRRTAVNGDDTRPQPTPIYSHALGLLLQGRYLLHIYSTSTKNYHHDDKQAVACACVTRSTWTLEEQPEPRRQLFRRTAA